LFDEKEKGFIFQQGKRSIRENEHLVEREDGVGDPDGEVGGDDLLGRHPAQGNNRHTSIVNSSACVHLP